MGSPVILSLFGSAGSSKPLELYNEDKTSLKKGRLISLEYFKKRRSLGSPLESNLEFLSLRSVVVSH